MFHRDVCPAGNADFLGEPDPPPGPWERQDGRYRRMGLWR